LRREQITPLPLVLAERVELLGPELLVLTVHSMGFLLLAAVLVRPTPGLVVLVALVAERGVGQRALAPQDKEMRVALVTVAMDLVVGAAPVLLVVLVEVVQPVALAVLG
jgi:hypothetical protein